MGQTVLITGAGGVAVPGMIRHLRGQGHRVLAADMDEHAPGLYFADKGFVIPAATDEAFQPRMHEICFNQRVDILIPLVDEELVQAKQLEGEGLKVLCPRVEFLKLSLDKLALCNKLSHAGIGGLETTLLDNDVSWEYPSVVKPRYGRGSRGVQILQNEADLRKYRQETDYDNEEVVVQPYIEGEEYTTSVVAWGGRDTFGVVPKRIHLKRGVTRIAQTERNETILQVGHRIQEEFRADGPFNVQLMIDEETGDARVFEINPRFSTSISLTIAAGADELGELVRYAGTGGPAPDVNDWRDELFLVRHSQDSFLSGDEFWDAQPIRADRGSS